MTNWLLNLFSPKRRRRSPKRKSKRRSPKRRSKRRSPKRRSKRRSPKRRSKRRSSDKYREVLRQKIKSSDWFIVTMSGCGYCTESKKILLTHNQKFKTVRLTENNSAKIWEVTDNISKKYRYFPMIFSKGKFFGGYRELKKKFPK
jgi:glutaredoxin